MSNGPRFAIVDRRVNGQNRTAVQTFARLANASTERALKPAEAKRFARLQVQLMRTGVVVLLTKKVVTDHARAIYAALPWKKLLLRVRYHVRSVRNRLAWHWLRLRS
jgi:hypothetical protein